MFIPFIENSFKHGLNNQLDDGYVNIDMDVDHVKVNMSIENSKISTLPAMNHKKSGGIGLINVKRRLNLLYPNRYKLDIADSPNAYQINLSIEL